MNRVEKALIELEEMDTLASGHSVIQRLCPLAKLVVTIGFMVSVISFGKYDLFRMFPMLLYPVLVFQLSGVPVRTCFYKLRFVIPLVLAVGIFNPLFDRAPAMRLGSMVITGGVISMITLMLKGILCLMASFLLAATTTMDALCAAMRRLHIPGFAVTLLLLTYRYVSVMTEELAIMSEAYHLRAPGQKGIHYKAWGSFLGQLLLRSMDRAEELYTSMMLRGFHGEFHYAREQKCTWKEAVYTAVWIGLFLLLRSVNVTELLGRLVTGL